MDKYTLKLTFKTPTTPEDFLLDKNREYYVLPTHLLEGTAPEDVMELALWDEPVGSGPCKFVSETPGSQLVLEANPDYQLGRPGFDRLVITVIDKSNLLTSLIAGDLGSAFGGNVSVEDAEVARAAGLEVLEGTVPNSFYQLMLNNETIPSAAVRRAIDLALDKEALCLHTARAWGSRRPLNVTRGRGMTAA
ncbi:ABC transporter substrate-binding protein [Flavonifractor plautii]|uniref:ABC transporter substrate-binding protein n=1 Tax=Flavonifractor plautii TaxID=292800 RepID=UPI003EE97202